MRGKKVNRRLSHDPRLMEVVEIDPHKRYVITVPEDSPPSVLDDIRKALGQEGFKRIVLLKGMEVKELDERQATRDTNTE